MDLTVTQIFTYTVIASLSVFALLKLVEAIMDTMGKSD